MRKAFTTNSPLLLLLLVASFSFGQTKSDSVTVTHVKKSFFREHGELSFDGISQRRDMSLYDEGGHYDCREWIVTGKGVCDEIKIRDFIWEHWANKKRGYIRISYNSVDAGATHHIFIEPVRNEWTVVWRILFWSALPGSRNELRDLPKLYSLERVEDMPTKGKWAIKFKTKDGSTIETMPEFNVKE
jgi:hypothetical protein